MLLVVSFVAKDGADPILAARLEDEVAAELSLTHEVARIDEVPPFEVHGYTAERYLEACPPRQYAGCALVLGRRMDAEWALGATLRSDAEGVLQIQLVHVSGARVVADVGVPMSDEVVAGTAQLVTQVMAGDYALRDLRATEIAVAGIAGEQAAVGREADAAELAALETEVGEPMVIREPAPIKHPWTPNAPGRAGRLLFRIGAGYSNGPWHQDYFSQVERDAATLEPVGSVEVLHTDFGGTGVLEADLGFGLSRTLEIGLAGSWLAGETTVERSEKVVGEPTQLAAPVEIATGTWLAGVRFGVVPYPPNWIRPTFTCGLSVWVGRGSEEAPPLERLPPPRQLIGHLIPGLELDVNDAVAVYVRGSLDMNLGGGEVTRVDNGEIHRSGSAQSHPSASITAGLLVRTGRTRGAYR